MVKWFLFETRIGGWLLSLLERWAGLAVVGAESLAMQRADLVSPADQPVRQRRYRWAR